MPQVHISQQPTDFSAIRFRGTFRDYQQTVLNNAEHHLQDKKVHIVAAPGSGKTILGLELIRHLNMPTLVLSPTVTIRQQWGDRFEERFLPEGKSLDEYLSFDLKEQRLIISVTYQALHAAAAHLINRESTDINDGEEATTTEGEERIPGNTGEAPTNDRHTPLSSPNVIEVPRCNEEKASSSELTMKQSSVSSETGVTIEDFEGFDLVQRMKDAGIKVLCLDEAHHLRSEWHKALTNFIKQMDEDLIIISLTATPPYDATSSEWKRYESLCGLIDEEIFVPELVLKKTLCPHQDYIYFSYPTQSEKEALKKYRRSAEDFLSKIEESRILERVLQSAGLFDDFALRLETVLKNEPEFFNLFRMANRFGVKLSPEIQSLIESRKHYKNTRSWRKSWREFEQALQFVIDNPELFGSEVPEELYKTAAQHGLIERRKLRLLADGKITRMLISSMGKLQGLSRIVTTETAHMGSSLRMLILTDFIRKEQLNIVGTDATIAVMGAVPIFESVRRVVGEGVQLALLSGTLVLVPNASCEGIAAIAKEKQLTCSFKPLPDVAYSEALFQGSNKNKVAVMTEAFQQGLIHILIGTKSLLGEGWDSPCINTLILATFVGSFMLSNQMRGRAIRVDSKVHDKTANIWHLVTLEPVIEPDAPLATKVLYSGLEQGRELDGDDWDTLVRRFDCFMGPAYARNSIESGVERIDILTPPFDREGIARINAAMEAKAQDRQAMAASWQATETAGFYPVVETSTEVSDMRIPTSFYWVNSLPLVGYVLIEAVLGLIMYLIMSMRVAGDVTSGIVLLALAAVMGLVLIVLARGVVRASRFLSPKKAVTSLAEAVLASLRQASIIKSLGAKIHLVANPDHSRISFSLRQASVHEQHVFSEAMRELLSPIENPKYVLIKLRRGKPDYAHSYACPSALSAKKEDAELLQENLGHISGKFALVYTYQAQGREILWECCCRSYVNKNHEIIKKLTARFE